MPTIYGDRLRDIGISILIMLVISVIVGVVWTASTGQSGQRVYLWSALIGMLVFFLGIVIIFGIQDNPSIYEWIETFVRIIAVMMIVLGVGFIITALWSAGTGHTGDSMPYLISAVASVSIFLFVVGMFLSITE